MKTKLFSLLVALFIITSCSNSNNTSIHKNDEPTITKKPTTKEALINDGWTELATVATYIEKNPDKYHDESYMVSKDHFIIFYKGEHYVAIESRDKNLIGCTRHSVSKGNYRKCGETYSGIISWHGMNLYFNF